MNPFPYARAESEEFVIGALHAQAAFLKLSKSRARWAARIAVGLYRSGRSAAWAYSEGLRVMKFGQ